NRDYSDMPSKVFDHFVYLAHAMNDLGPEGIELWNEGDGFYYGVLHVDDREHIPLKVRSMVGVMPLFAIAILESDLIDQLPRFKRRMEWFINNWGDIHQHLESWEELGHGGHLL